MPEIYQKINAIMRDLPAISKSQQNMQQHFAYRGIDDVMNALFPLLAKHGVFVVPEVLETSRTERLTKSGSNMAFTVSRVKYTFFATDGSSVCAVTTGEGMDSADKSTNKAMAAAMKYAFFQTFCIPTEEVGADDPDRETPEGSTPITQSLVNLPVCADCGCEIRPSKKRTAQQLAHDSKAKFGRVLCASCGGDELARREAAAT